MLQHVLICCKKICFTNLVLFIHWINILVYVAEYLSPILSWLRRTHDGFNVCKLDLKQNGNILKIPKMILLATNINITELIELKLQVLPIPWSWSLWELVWWLFAFSKFLEWGKKEDRERKWILFSTKPSPLQENIGGWWQLRKPEGSCRCIKKVWSWCEVCWKRQSCTWNASIAS